LHIFLDVGQKTIAILNFAKGVLDAVSEAAKWGVPNFSR
jgi:hypothetical protein